MAGGMATTDSMIAKLRIFSVMLPWTFVKDGVFSEIPLAEALLFAGAAA